MTNSQVVAQTLRTADNFLWNASALSIEQSSIQQQIPDFTNSARNYLISKNVGLNEPQWNAWERSLQYRLTLVWGPPGTGKSQTLRAIAEGMCVAAWQQHRPLRILICAANYNAFDNVLIKTANWLADSNIDPKPAVYRLRSPFKSAFTGSSNVNDTLNDPSNQLVMDLDRRLRGRIGITVVAATPEGIFKLITKGDKSATPIKEYFDFIILDEASQIDVGHTLPFLCAASSDAQVVLAGDPMQLDPISKTPAPEGAEYMVGSVYTYIKSRFASTLSAGVEKTLEINYRSNDEIVAYGRRLCYDSSYRSFSPQLRLNLQNLTTNQLSDWPDWLEWTEAWANLLNPNVPIVCFNYREGRSGQSNRFESQAITSLIWLLWNSGLQKQLLNENGLENEQQGSHSFDTFWKQGIGVVTPHSAQRAQIITDLKRAFKANGNNGRLIRDAVDTVEKFQGQQRDVIIASFAVGDPDLVAQEDEFLLQLNRFNVMASRPRAKLIVFVTDEILDHLSSDLEVLANSRAIKVFAGEFCENPTQLTLPWRDRNNLTQYRPGTLRTRP